MGLYLIDARNPVTVSKYTEIGPTFHRAPAAPARIYELQFRSSVLREGTTDMTIEVSFTTKGSIDLRATSFRPDEFEALKSVLLEAGLGGPEKRIRFKSLKTDRGRMVRRYVVPENLVESLESLLGGRFERVEKPQPPKQRGKAKPAPAVAAKATFHELPRVGSSGRNFACREIKPGGEGKGCEDLTAADETSALVKCALIASRNGWFGGHPDSGSCSSGN